MIYNLYITYYDKKAKLNLVLARNEVKRIAVNTNEILVYYSNHKIETIILEKVYKVELVEENLDNTDYIMERG